MTGDGLLLVDKQSGITSHDVVDLFRRATGMRKAGHTGTLDPMATGLLALCIGRATRLQAFLTGMEKSYEGAIQFGWATATYDAEGEPAGEPLPVDVSHIDWEPALQQFRGTVEQMPPAYSAKKIEGRRAYAIARAGEEPQLKAREVTFHEVSITGVEGSVVRFAIRCSAGTYVRSFAHDLGQKVGIPAHLKELRRTAIGELSVEQAIASAAFRDLSANEIFAAPHFIPLEQVDLPFAAVVIDSTQEGKLLHGQSVIAVPSAPVVADDLLSVSNLDGELVAIGRAVRVMREGGPVEIHPKVVLKNE
jgi:tRNA pseudouridine55 synthase